MFIFGLSVSLIGMGTVIFALVLLMGIIKTMSQFAALTERVTVLEKRGRGGPPVLPVAAPPVEAENDEEIAAVITAALAAFLRKS